MTAMTWNWLLFVMSWLICAVSIQMAQGVSHAENVRRWGADAEGAAHPRPPVLRSFVGGAAIAAVITVVAPLLL